MTAGTLTGAAFTYLSAQADLTALLGSDSKFDHWVFQEKPYAIIEGSQACAIVLTRETGWTSNDATSMEFPRLGIQVWADPQRDVQRNVTFDDTSDKIEVIVRALNKYLHITSGRDMWWGDLRVLTSTRLGEPAFSDIPDGDHARTCMVFYGLTLGGWR